VERFCLAPAGNGASVMFDSREDALAHRDAVVDVLGETFDGEPWHVHPVLDGAVVRIEEEHLDAATSALSEGGFPVERLAESGDWHEIKAKPQNDG
jgi:hypothetical protein